MPDKLGLLLKPVSIERSPVLQPIGISAKRMAHHYQVEASACLRLPDVGHFVNEQALQRKSLFGKIIRPQRTFGVEVDVAGRGHDNALWLERPPFAPDKANTRIIDCIAKHRYGEFYFAGREGTCTFHRGERVRRPSSSRREDDVRLPPNASDARPLPSARLAARAAQNLTEEIPHERDRRSGEENRRRTPWRRS